MAPTRMTLKQSSPIWTLILGVACFGCGGSGTTSSSNGGAGTPSSSGTPSDSETPDETPDETSTEAPTLASIQSSIFAKSCGGNLCHGAGGRGGLKLTNTATSCANLVDVAVEDSAQTPECPTGGAAAAGMKRVVPGDPSASFLYLKLLGDAECVSVGGKTAGERMPKGDPPLSAAQIATVERWIKAGASCD